MGIEKKKHKVTSSQCYVSLLVLLCAYEVVSAYVEVDSIYENILSKKIYVFVSMSIYLSACLSIFLSFSSFDFLLPPHVSKFFLFASLSPLTTLQTLLLCSP